MAGLTGAACGGAAGVMLEDSGAIVFGIPMGGCFGATTYSMIKGASETNDESGEEQVG